MPIHESQHRGGLACPWQWPTAHRCGRCCWITTPWVTTALPACWLPYRPSRIWRYWIWRGVVSQSTLHRFAFVVSNLCFTGSLSAPVGFCWFVCLLNTVVFVREQCLGGMTFCSLSIYSRPLFWLYLSPSVTFVVHKTTAHKAWVIHVLHQVHVRTTLLCVFALSFCLSFFPI